MARLSISLLGPFHVSLDGRTLSGFESNKVRALLAYLAVESGRPHARDSLATLLWPNYLNRSAVNNLRSVLANLRHVIGDSSATPPFLIISRDTIQFNSTADYELDVDAFRSATTCSMREADTLLATYRGNFLEGFALPDNEVFEEWLQGRREQLRREMLEALDWLAARALQQSGYSEAAAHARRQLEMDNLRESSHRQLIRALALLGQRTEALVQFELCSHLLREELDVEPSAETRALAEQIARGDIAEPPPAAAQPSAASVHYNLPAQSTSFIGRDAQLEMLINLLIDPAVHLITVTGPGGIGKTRLAQEAARRSVDHFRHGVFFIALESATMGDDIIDRLMTGLGIRNKPSIPHREAVLNLLRNKQALLVLDTFEHLQQEVDIISRIREFAPDVKLLVTSRSVLKLSGEKIYIVPPLANPESVTDPVAITRSDAVDLFKARAQEVQPDFTITTANVGDVVEICRMLGGLPLALELAAAHTRTLSLRQLRRQLMEGDELLAGGPRDAPARHRSIQDTLAWSYDLLSPAQQALFRCLGIFSEGCTLAAAEAVAPESMRERSLFIDILSGLIDHSLIQTQNINGRRIYRLHEITSRFANDRLTSCGELDQTMSRLLDYILELAKQVDQHFRDTSRDHWLSVFEPEATLVWRTLEWGLATNDVATVRRCLSLSGHMLQYWNVRGQHDLARQWTEKALGYAAQLNLEKSFLGPALITAASMALVHADIKDSLAHAEAALLVARETGDRALEIRALHLIGLCAFARDELALAGEIWTTAQSLADELGDPALLTITLDDLGNLAARRGDFDQAIGFHLREQATSLEAGDLYSEFYAAINLGEVSMLMERPVDAAFYYDRAMKLCRDMGDSRGLAQTMITQSALLIQLHRSGEARKLLCEAISLSWAIQNLDIVLRGLEMLLHSDVIAMSLETQARLAGAISHLSEQYSSASLPTDKEALAALKERLSREMNRSAFTLEWGIGRTYSWEQAVELAQEAIKAGISGAPVS